MTVGWPPRAVSFTFCHRAHLYPVPHLAIFADTHCSTGGGRCLPVRVRRRWKSRCSYQLTTNNSCGWLNRHMNYKYHKTENIMNRTLLLYHSFLILTLVSCQSSKKRSRKQNEELVAEKQLAFPLDEQTYYLSKSMFQFGRKWERIPTLKIHQKIIIRTLRFGYKESTTAKRIPSSQNRSQRTTGNIRQ